MSLPALSAGGPAVEPLGPDFDTLSRVEALPM